MTAVIPRGDDHRRRSPPEGERNIRAAILEKVGETTLVVEIDEPKDDFVQVRLAGCNPVDLALAAGRMGKPVTPSVVGKEGIGTNAGGARVYIDSPPRPFGSWAQRCPVDNEKVFPVPGTGTN